MSEIYNGMTKLTSMYTLFRMSIKSYRDTALFEEYIAVSK